MSLFTLDYVFVCISRALFSSVTIYFATILYALCFF